MTIVGIIPARMAATRFPGKPLAKILEIPMLGHVFFRSRMSDVLDQLYIATCDQEISEYVNSIGGNVIMTKDTHQRASDRTAEAMLKIESETGHRVDIVVMIQGDEPMVYPEMINEAIKPLLEDDRIMVSNLMAPIKSRKEYEDVNEIKVVVDKEGYALYFSREPIPSCKKGAISPLMMKQVCIIPFQRDLLIKFNQLEPTPLEIAESIDMLRVLEHGYKVKMILVNRNTYSVDTLEDLKHVAKLMAHDPLIKQYEMEI